MPTTTQRRAALRGGFLMEAHMTRLLTVLALVLALAACDTSSPDPVDLSPVEDRLDRIEAKIDATPETQPVATDAILEELGNVQANLATLTMAAAEIRSEVNRPIDLKDVRVGDWSGLIVYTRSGGNVWIQPGACDSEATPVSVPAGETIVGTWHQAPTGPHCLSASEASAVGVTIDVQPGTIASVILPDEFEVVE